MPGPAPSELLESKGSDALLARLAFPRQNGSAALDTAYAVLDSALDSRGVTARTIDFPCQTWRAEMASAACLLFVLALGLVAWRRWRFGILATMLAAIFVLAAGAGWLDVLLPRTTGHVLVTQSEPHGPARHEILLTAHYDTKTEPLDHVGRSVLFAAAAAAAVLTAALGLRRRSAVRPAWLVTAALGVAAAVQLGWGGRTGARSAGVVDDGAACVLLAELASTYAGSPLQHTRVTCVWFAGEEVGAQGSAALAPLLAHAGVLACINLEAIGAGTDLAVSRHEMHGLRPYRASRAVRARLAQAAGAPLRDLPWPLWTDAGPLLASRLPALTLLTLPPGANRIHGLHTARDTRARFDPRGYARARDVLQRCLAAADTP